MFSLNIPLPPDINRLANRLHPQLSEFDRVRERHTLVCKRLGPNLEVESIDGTNGDVRPSETVAELREEIRPLVRNTPPFQVEITGIDAFSHPQTGPGPVVYLVVESQQVYDLHRRLTRAFGAIDGLEGDAYVPHVTLARGLSDTIGASPGDYRETAPESSTETSHESALKRRLETLRNAAGEIDIIWRVEALDLWDSRFREPASRIRLKTE